MVCWCSHVCLRSLKLQWKITALFPLKLRKAGYKTDQKSKMNFDPANSERMRTTCGSTKEADTDTAAQPLLLRKVPIPDDNSCLFHALAYLGATQEQQAVGKREEARALRRVCADAALQHPELFLPSSEGSEGGEGAKGGDELSLAMQLGMEPEIYATKIMGPAWGGTNEILVLAKRYDIEVALVKHGLSTPLVYNKRRRKRYETASSLSSPSSSALLLQCYPQTLLKIIVRESQ